MDFKKVNGWVYFFFLYNGQIIVSYNYLIGTFDFYEIWMRIE